MTYGIPFQRHLMKVEPFTLRLTAATDALTGAVAASDTAEMARGLEDVGFWTARTVAEMISAADAAETPAHEKLFKRGMAALFKAQSANVRARKALVRQTSYSGPVGNIPDAARRGTAMVAGPLMVLASSGMKSPWSTLVLLAGGGATAWAFWDWLSRNGEIQ